jgi:hypothetical protein
MVWKSWLEGWTVDEAVFWQTAPILCKRRGTEKVCREPDVSTRTDSHDIGPVEGLVFVVHAVDMGMGLVDSLFSFLGIGCEKSLGNTAVASASGRSPASNPIS